MVFNSIEFAIFLPIVFSLYWWIGSEKIKTQNILILISSYIFYGTWDYRFLILIFISSLVDFTIGIKISNSSHPRSRKYLLWTSLIFNLGLLAFFKYFNFFIDSFVSSFKILGYQLSANSIDIILPVGISFYTFQTISYIIDVYRKDIEASHDPIDFFAYVAFFPQLIAGPIERAKRLLPQFQTKRVFDYDSAVDGTRQILLGLFKKVVIADNCAVYANEIFQNYHQLDSLSLFLGAFYFLIQVYCDFSGYSDIAIGLGKLFGFHLMKNFDFPFLSRDLPEFWKKWHISLTSWFVDYLYIPLGGGRNGLTRKIRNVLIIFTVCGFWHGANWTFLFWGIFCGLSFIPYLLLGQNGKYTSIIGHQRFAPSPKEFIQMASVVIFMTLSMILFRSQNITNAYQYFIRLAAMNFEGFNITYLRDLPYAGLILIWEWTFRSKNHAFEISSLSKLSRNIIYAVSIWLILFNFNKDVEYIYFQF